MVSSIFVLIIFLVGILTSGSAANRPVEETLLIFVTFSLVFSICSFIFHIYKINFLPLLPLAGVLLSTGLIMLYGINPAIAILQLKWITVLLPAITFITIAIPNYKTLSKYKYIFGFIGLALIISPVFFGVEKYGAKLWLKFGVLSFQPAEIGKIFLAIFFAGYLAERHLLLSSGTSSIGGVRIPHIRHFGPLLLIWIISLLLLIFEKDLGSSLLFFGLFSALLYGATNKLIYPLFSFILFFFGCVFAYYLFPHIQTRFDIWINPFIDIQGKGYQIVQSLFAISGGGFWGRGIGYGFPSLIPAVQNDFIFSLISEESGLIGASAIIMIYVVLISIGIKISLASNNVFGKLLSLGLISALALQTFVIIGGVTKLIPMTGVTLPFVSYGGSSLFSNLLLIALLMKINSEET